MNVYIIADTISTTPGETMRYISSKKVGRHFDAVTDTAQELHYDQSAHYHSDISEFEPEVSHLFSYRS